MRFHNLPKDFEITKPAKQWSNGLIVSEFRALGFLWDIKRSIGTNGRGDTEPFYTYINAVETWPPADRAPTPPWLDGYHIPSLPGTVEPDTAAMILGMIKTQWERGEEAGRRNQQEDFRKVIGVQ